MSCPIDTPELKNLNCALFGTYEGLYSQNYLDSEKVIASINKYFDNHKPYPITIGTQRKYYVQLCTLLFTLIDFPEHITESYKQQLKIIDAKYNEQIKHRNETKHLVDDNEIKQLHQDIQHGIESTYHQSIKIIGKFFLCIDVKQPNMLMMKFQDFADTTIDKTLNNSNFLDIETGIWNVNSLSFTINKEFCDFVKEQHGPKTRTNLKWLIGQRKTFVPYTNTSTFSAEFSKTFDKFNTIIDKFRSYSKWLIEEKPMVDNEIKPKLSIKLKFKEIKGN